MRQDWAYNLKASTLVVLLAGCLSGHYPPARAQQLAADDRLQNQRLDQIDEHLKATDQRLTKQWDTVNAVRDAQTHMEGVTEGFGALLTLMVGGSITLQVRKKSA